MKQNKKRWMMLIVLVGVALGTGWWMSSRQTEEPMDAATRVPKRTVEDQRLVDSVLESPEQLDASVAASIGLSSPEPVPVADPVAAAPRPQLLSEIEKPLPPAVEREPVPAESLYFWKDYASMRKAEIRDPNSEENRAGVVSLMKARQRRLGQTGH